jgi:hypothetical protein
MNESTLFIVLLLAIYGLAIVFIPRYMIDRASRQVVNRFREHRATGKQNAKTAEALGLGPRSLMGRLAHPARDYKPYALAVLIHNGIIDKTEDGRMYLSERRLADFCLQGDNPMKACTL